MLTACIKTEQMKLKHSHLWLVFLAIPSASHRTGCGKLCKQYRDIEIGVVFSVDAAFSVLCQFFLWPSDCHLLFLYMESGAPQLQLEQPDDDAHGGEGIFFWPSFSWPCVVR